MTTLIKNGLVVSPQGAIAADVLIDGEKIAAVLTPGETTKPFLIKVVMLTPQARGERDLGRHQVDDHGRTASESAPW